MHYINLHFTYLLANECVGQQRRSERAYWSLRCPRLFCQRPLHCSSQKLCRENYGGYFLLDFFKRKTIVFIGCWRCLIKAYCQLGRGCVKLAVFHWSWWWWRCPMVICSRNRVPGPGSKIHYPVSNPVIDTRFLHSLLMKNTILAVLCIFYVMTLTSLYFVYDWYYFRWPTYSHLIPQLRTFNMKKHRFVKKCWVIGCVCIIALSFSLLT